MRLRLREKYLTPKTYFSWKNTLGADSAGFNKLHDLLGGELSLWCCCIPIIYSDLRKCVPRNWCGKFLQSVSMDVCLRPCMSVYRPPGAVYQLDWDPLDNSGSVYAMHPTATTTAGNQLSLLSEVQPEQFLDTIVRFSWLGVLPWPGKVPELRPQMLLSWSYLLRFLHEELNCCNIGLRGRAGCKTKTAPDTKFVRVADSSGGGGGIKASLGRDRMSSEPTTLLPLIFRPWPGGIGCLGKCREQPAKPLEVWRHLLARGHRRRPLAITLCQARFVLFYLLRLNLFHTNPIPGSLFLSMPCLTEILNNFKENRAFGGKIMLH